MSNQSTAVLFKKIVEQLSKEAKNERLKVSETAKDLIQYCSQHAAGDPLVSGVPYGENPFVEKSRCTLV
ncbi:Guanine nucleotide-binding protein G(I)/G(S)/G(O) subunit gamma-7 [Trichoplax sp. H2]|uniref:Guanine nucleotide-binding protein subunit gamma n=1 Tax=Trichoplax adhaerens TaxID=10228 RepID=A0A3S8RDA5_TRIAD|nr:G protein gamma subunit 2 [Trichoplax adhaerens]RDD40327.1 Guanine nucleotide-binding protein G(I)/G(S)/G(O) subunit gamma-7 [Trichoplax sp. H2]|eukprot:RDD40327.1 Guanine nucleotide-binding protein G(I)/G(S)/G(O) subunit gamma-7 [Trichoplax sp. H2]